MPPAFIRHVIDVMSAPAGLQIRPPSPMERRAWRMLLPEPATAPDACRVLVALMPLDTDTPRIVGATAATRHHILVPRRGPRVHLHVIPPVRRRGIGRALIQTLAARVSSQDAGVEALLAWTPVRPDSDEAAVWQALGFTGRADVVVHAVDGVEVARAMRPIIDRYAPRMPADARVVSLAEITDVQRDQIAELHLRHLGGTAGEIHGSLARDGDDTTETDHVQPYWPGSPVLLRGDRVVGFSLSRPGSEPGVIRIDATVVDPDHRHGWANALLKYEQAVRSVAAGLPVGHFQTFEHHVDTKKFARRLGDHVVRRLAAFYMPLAPEGRHRG